MNIESTSVITDNKGEAVIMVQGTFSVPVDGEKMAGLFWQMHGERQAQFFNALGAIMVRDGYAFDAQLGYFVKDLDRNGHKAVRAFYFAMIEARGISARF